MKTTFITKCVSVMGHLNLEDRVKSFIAAAGSAFADALTETLSAGHWPRTTEWKHAAIAGLSIGTAYLLHKLFSGPTKAEAQKAADEAKNAAATPGD